MIDYLAKDFQNTTTLTSTSSAIPSYIDINKLDFLLKIVRETGYYQDNALIERSELNKAVYTKILSLVKEVFPEPVKEEKKFDPYIVAKGLNPSLLPKTSNKDFFKYLLETLKELENQEVAKQKKTNDWNGMQGGIAREAPYKDNDPLTNPSQTIMY